MNVHWRLPKWLPVFYGLIAILIVLMLPFLTLGWVLEPQIEHWLDQCRQWPMWVGLFGAIALVVDVFLPIPSSFVCTTLGQILGILPATFVCTLGFQGGAWLGWWVGRQWGGLWIEKCCGRETLQMGKEALDKWGVWAIFLTRPIPLFAEAVVLLLGTHPDRFTKWILALLLSNFSVALAWASLGQWSQSEHQVSLASIMSVLVPIIAMLMLQRWRSRATGRFNT